MGWGGAAAQTGRQSRVYQHRRELTSGSAVERQSIAALSKSSNVIRRGMKHDRSRARITYHYKQSYRECFNGLSTDLIGHPVSHHILEMKTLYRI